MVVKGKTFCMLFPLLFFLFVCRSRQIFAFVLVRPSSSSFSSRLSTLSLRLKFKGLCRSQQTKQFVIIEGCPASELAKGERKIIDGPNGEAIILANLEGKFFAVNAKCPHLGLPMKRGAIEAIPSSRADASFTPTITCNFHKSSFNMETGICTKWSESVFGIPGTEGLGNLVGGLGGTKNSPATVYSVTVTEEGMIQIEV